MPLMRDFSILLYLHNGERSKNHLKSSSGSLEKERDRETETETEKQSGKRRHRSSSFRASSSSSSEREKERKRERFVPCHPCLCFIVGARNQILCGVFDDFEDKKGEEKKESFCESAAQLRRRERFKNPQLLHSYAHSVVVVVGGVVVFFFCAVVVVLSLF